MRTTIRRRAAVSMAAPLLALTLVACGGDNDTGAATDDAAAGASESTSESASSEAQPGTDGEAVAAGEEVDAQAFIEDLRAAMESAESAQMAMTMAGGGADVTMKAQVDYASDPPQMAAVMAPATGQTIEFRLVDSFVYMNLGQLSQNKFIKADINDPKGPLGDLSGIQESMDPVSSFESFAQGLEKVVYVGDEKVGGTQAGHYRLTLDTAKIDAMNDLAGSPAGGAAPGLPKTLTYDLWLDSENRMRQVEMDMGKKLGSMEMSVSKWNEPVQIEAPPAKQVTSTPGR